MNIPNDEITTIDLGDDWKEQGLEGQFAYVCDNCGQQSFVSKEKIKHAKKCKAGECKKWQKYYEEETK